MSASASRTDSSRGELLKRRSRACGTAVQSGPRRGERPAKFTCPVAGIVDAGRLTHSFPLTRPVATALWAVANKRRAAPWLQQIRVIGSLPAVALAKKGLSVVEITGVRTRRTPSKIRLPCSRHR